MKKRHVLCLAAAIALASSMTYATEPEADPMDQPVVASQSEADSEDSELSKMVSSLNETAPSMMASGIRFDIASKDGEHLRLDYTMTEVAHDPLYLANFTRMVRPTLTRVLCSAKATESLALRGTPLKTVFSDNEGNVVADITTQLSGCHRPLNSAEEVVELTPAEKIGVSYSSRVPLEISDLVRLEAVEVKDSEVIYKHTIIGEEGMSLHENPSIGSFVRVAVTHEMCDALQQNRLISEQNLTFSHQISNEEGTDVGTFTMTSNDCV